MRGNFYKKNITSTFWWEIYIKTTDEIISF